MEAPSNSKVTCTQQEVLLQAPNKMSILLYFTMTSQLEPYILQVTLSNHPNETIMFPTHTYMDNAEQINKRA